MIRKEKDILTRAYAQKRAKLIGDVNYDVHLIFKKKAKTYQGNCKIFFFLNKIENIRLETISKIKRLLVNEKLCKYKKEDFSIILPKKYLKKGNNSIEIIYTAGYDYTGSGLHHFTDPEDNEEYLYSNFEPYSAHRMFPCFDQPDIKATYLLAVNSPKNWLIVSNTFGKEKINGKIKTTEFERTKKFSTYLFHVSAGPYHVFKAKHKGMKIRIFCRKSFKKYFPVKEIFKVTKYGLSFYEKYFDFSYPFEKYDQIFVPEFNSLAMENVAAVVFSERLIPRRKLTYTEEATLANVILHEMVHMWFGDLVTMKWWDDIWLNESFADFLSYFGMVKATKFKDSWQRFYVRKAWAYYQDQLITTHPISANASDTDIAFENFDGISYAKGAAVLKQLMFYIGKSNFREGMRIYFKKFQWQNTELKDFLYCLEKASGKNLKPWTKIWIKTGGVNTIIPSYKVKNNKIKSFSIIQYPSKYNKILRPHKTKIALFKEKNNACKKIKEIPITYYKKETEIKQFEGKSPPALVYLNYEDYDYARDILDENSLNYVLNNINKVKDYMTKQMIYGALWRMVRDALLSPIKYLNFIMKNVEKEKNLLLLERILLQVSSILDYYVNDINYQKYCNVFYKIALRNLLEKDNPKDNKNAWFSLLTTTALGSKSQKELIDLIENKLKIKNFEFDQDKRWEILETLATINHPLTIQLIKEEIKKDRSDKGKKWLATIEASFLKNKNKFWKMFIEGKDSLDYIRSGMQGFYSRKQRDNLRKYIGLFFKHVNKVFIEKDRYYSKDFFRYLFPHLYINKETLQISKNFLKKNKNKLPELLEKQMLEGIDEMQRGLRILEKYENKE